MRVSGATMMKHDGAHRVCRAKNSESSAKDPYLELLKDLYPRPILRRHSPVLVSDQLQHDYKVGLCKPMRSGLHVPPVDASLQGVQGTIAV